MTVRDFLKKAGRQSLEVEIWSHWKDGPILGQKKWDGGEISQIPDDADFLDKPFREYDVLDGDLVIVYEGKEPESDWWNKPRNGGL